MVIRENYLQKLHQLRDKGIVKIISGVRRAGKSTLLAQFRDELRKSGVKDENIIARNFEDLNLLSASMKDIHDGILNGIATNSKNYVFLDEIQNVPEFEKLVDSLFIRENIDLYITGSNAYFLSGEWATLLSGRYMEIEVLPFSFAEYLQMFDDNSRLDLRFADYLKNGGFPLGVDMFRESYDNGIDYLRGIFNTIVMKDIIEREKIADPEALNNVLRFVFDNIGSFVSPNKIANYLRANFREIAPRTVDKFLTAACESLIIYEVNRFNIRGKEQLQTQQKYYLVDNGFRQMLLGKEDNVDVGHLLENLVYLELRRRGYQIWVGQTKNGREVDFVARNRQGNLEYYQVAETMRDEQTRERELSALNSIDDNNPKIVITMDIGENNYAGIIQINVVDWLTNADI